MMRDKKLWRRLGAAWLVALPLLGLKATQYGMDGPASTRISRASVQEIRATYSRLALSFEANQGQADPEVKFLSRGSGYTLFLASTKAVLTLRQPAPEQTERGALPALGRPGAVEPVKARVLQMELRGASPDGRMAGLEQLPGKSNYFIGNDPAKWRRNVPHYAKVICRGVYPGVDLVYYGTNDRQLEYDFTVAPGADPALIRLRFEGADSLDVDSQGHLVLHLPGGEVSLHRPDVYQEVNGERHDVGGGYALKGQNEVAFEVSAYDASKPLVIDPVLSYSTYLGSDGWEDLYDIAVDSQGSAYVTGMLFSPTYPTTPDAYDRTCGTSGDCNWNGTRNFSDAFVAKLSSDGASLVYSTYLGGADQDFGLDIAVDAGGSAYVTGQTGSVSDFPLKNAYQTAHGGGACTLTDGFGPVTSPCDVFIAALNPTGSDLRYSSYLGGSREEEGDAIVVDASGIAYVTGRTTSPDFPLRNALQTSPGGGTCGTEPDPAPCSDAFVAKIDPSKVGDSSLIYSTYLGGSNNENGNAIAIDASGNVYVAGATWSSDFATTADAYQKTCAVDASGSCTQDGFVTKINAAGSGRVYSTFLGGSNREGILGIALDSSGNAYVAGWTMSSDFPTTPGAFDVTCGTDGLCDVSYYDGFVAKLNATGSGLIYSTYLGGSQGEAVQDIVVDSLGIAYVAGQTASADFPRREAIDDACGGTEAFVAKLSANGAGLIFSTFLGGSENEGAKAIAVDAFRNVYVGGYTTSGDFTATPGAYDTVYGADGSYGQWHRDGFIAKLSDLALPLMVASTQSVDFGEQPLGTTSPPHPVTATNIGDLAQKVPPLNVTGDFAYASTCGTSIAPGSTCTINFTFTPTDVGTRSGGLLVYDEEGGQWYTAFSLSGVGVAISDGTLVPGSGPAGRVADDVYGDAASIFDVRPVHDFDVFPAGPLDVSLHVFDEPVGIPGVYAEGTKFVHVQIEPPQTYPLPPLGLSIVLPLEKPLPARYPTTSLNLMRVDPQTGALVPAKMWNIKCVSRRCGCGPSGCYGYAPVLRNAACTVVLPRVDCPPGTPASSQCGNIAICHSVATFSTLVGVFPEEISVTIDVKPGSEENPVNLATGGLVPVAILGDLVFDIDLLDVTTLRFGPEGAGLVHDLTDPVVYAQHRQDVNKDGYLDLVCHFRQQETGIAPGDTEACIHGYTHDTGNGPRPVTGCGTLMSIR